jgi:hypothetical protein
LEQREQAYVLTVRSNEKLWAVRANKTGWYTAAELAASPSSQRLAVSFGRRRDQGRTLLRLGPPAPGAPRRAGAAALAALAADPA